MAQLTIYLDDETRDRIEKAARDAETSVSSWVKERLVRTLDTEWPEGYFELFGTLADVDLERPPQPPAEADRERQPLQ